MTRFAQPWALVALLALLPLFWHWWRRAKRPAALLHADLSLFEDAKPTMRVRLRHLPRALRVLFLVLGVIAIAGPESGVVSEEISTFGVDIVTVLDRSSSMLALDFEPDRITVARHTIRDFAEGRERDRVGLVVFAREAFTACPLTLDRRALLGILAGVEIAGREDDGTAIGLGLASAVNRLKESDAESRVVVLVTDGENNAGEIAPLTAAELANELGIRVYTIGVGSYGYTPFPQRDRFGRLRRQAVRVEIDEDTLKRIAELTGGRYFRAAEQDALAEVFATIDELERSEIRSEVHVDWSARFQPWLLAAGLVFLFELLVARWLVGRLP